MSETPRPFCLRDSPPCVSTTGGTYNRDPVAVRRRGLWEGGCVSVRRGRGAKAVRRGVSVVRLESLYLLPSSLVSFPRLFFFESHFGLEPGRRATVSSSLLRSLSFWRITAFPKWSDPVSFCFLFSCPSIPAGVLKCTSALRPETRGADRDGDTRSDPTPESPLLRARSIFSLI